MTESTKNENAGQLQLIAGMAMSGTIGLFVVWSGQSPFNVGFWRCLIGGLCLLLFCFAKGYLKLAHVSRLQWVLLAVSGVVLVLNWAALFASYLHAGIGVGTVIYNTQPFFLLLAGPLMFGERITLKQVLLAILAFGGVILIVLPALLGVEVDLLFLQGAGFALLAAVLYSGLTIVTKKLTGIKPHVVALCQLGVGRVFLATIMAFDQMPQTSMRWRCDDAIDSENGRARTAHREVDRAGTRRSHGARHGRCSPRCRCGRGSPSTPRTTLSDRRPSRAL